MNPLRRTVSLIIHADGALTSRTFRIPVWALRVLVALLAVVGIVSVLFVAFYVPIVRQAARVPGLERELDRLRTDNGRIRELAMALDTAEARYATLRTMLGADKIPDPVATASSVPVAPAIIVRGPRGRRYPGGATVPAFWPLDARGFLTRGQTVADSAGSETHPGIDIAVPIGTLVRASGGGTVVQAGTQPEYGLFVLLQHPGGYVTMYGHLSRVTVLQGAPVGAGDVIGRSGNTGNSSAPHLHFELRKNGVVVDPSTMVQEGR